MDKETIKSKAYGLMVMLGEIDNELRKGGEPVSLDEINEMYGIATEINEYFENED